MADADVFGDRVTTAGQCTLSGVAVALHQVAQSRGYDLFKPALSLAVHDQTCTAHDTVGCAVHRATHQLHEAEQGVVLIAVASIVQEQIGQADAACDRGASQVVQRTVEHAFAHVLTGGNLELVIVVIAQEQVVEGGDRTEQRHTLSPGQQGRHAEDTGDLLLGGFANFWVGRRQRLTCSLEQHVVHRYTVAFVHEQHLAD